MIQNFHVTGNPTIDCKLDCDVVIERGDSCLVQVIVEGSDKFIQSCKVSQIGNTIKIHSTSGNNGTTIINGVVMSGGSGNVISIGSSSGTTVITGGGTVIINGKRIDLNSLDDAPAEPKAKVTIYTPLANLDAVFNGSNEVIAQTPLNDVYLQTKGHNQIALDEVQSLDFDISGSGKISAQLTGGELSGSISGSGQLRSSGYFSKATVSISGSGQVYTSGQCTGDYKASVSGSGYIGHSGSITGRKRQNVSGTGNINI